MLRALPFTTFGEAAALGLEAHVYCPSCYTTRQLDPMTDNLRGRSFAGARFRCTNIHWTGNTCGGPGTVTIRPAELLPVGGDVRIAFLWCDRCSPRLRADVAALRSRIYARVGGGSVAPRVARSSSNRAVSRNRRAAVLIPLSSEPSWAM
jgi:hypothetical protein